MEIQNYTIKATYTELSSIFDSLSYFLIKEALLNAKYPYIKNGEYKYDNSIESFLQEYEDYIEIANDLATILGGKFTVFVNDMPDGSIKEDKKFDSAYEMIAFIIKRIKRHNNK